MMPSTYHSQRGVTLVIGLIMLILLTLMVTAAFNLSTSNLRSVGNMQLRDEAIAAANIAIELEVGSPFTNAPAAVTGRQIDINNDGAMDYSVDLGQDSDNDGIIDAGPACVRASQAINDSLSSVTLGASMSSSPYWNTVWDFDAIVTELHGSGASVRVRQGIRVLLSESQKNLVCS